MPYTNCSACGAKALVGATRCPRCQVSFLAPGSTRGRADVISCPKCGVQRPATVGGCPNCLASPASPGHGFSRRRLFIAAIAVILMMLVGYVIHWRSAAPVIAHVSTERVQSAPIATPVPAVREDTPVPASPKPAAARATKITPGESAPFGSWEAAIANTWVRIRAEPSRESGVVIIVLKGERVQLGGRQSGWRAIQVGNARGWVDPRFFTVVKTP